MNEFQILFSIIVGTFIILSLNYPLNKGEDMNRLTAVLVLIIVMFFTITLFAQGELPPAEIPLVISTLLGVLAPIVIQAVIRNVKSANGRAGIAIVLAAAIGLIAALIQGVPISLAPAYVAWIFTVSQSAFNLFWKPLFNATGFLKHE